MLLTKNEKLPPPPVSPHPREACVNKHISSRKLQQYRMEKIRALTIRTQHRFTCHPVFLADYRFWPFLPFFIGVFTAGKGWYQMAMHWHNLAVGRTFTRNPENYHFANIWGRERVLETVWVSWRSLKSLSWIMELCIEMFSEN